MKMRTLAAFAAALLLAFGVSACGDDRAAPGASPTDPAYDCGPGVGGGGGKGDTTNVGCNRTGP